jgi:hypothetical protein
MKILFPCFSLQMANENARENWETTENGIEEKLLSFFAFGFVHIAEHFQVVLRNVRSM